MNRLDELKDLQARKQAGSMVIMTNGEEFIEALETKIAQLKDVLSVGIDVRGVDSVIRELEYVNTLQPLVSDLHKAIKSIRFPDPPKYQKSVDIHGLDDFIREIKNINRTVRIDWFNKEHMSEITGKLEALTGAVKDIKAPEQSQDPAEFLPYRRVRKVGSTYLFDDESWASHGGGGGIPRDMTTRDGTAVAVTNPDGSLLNDNSTDIIDGTASNTDGNSTEVIQAQAEKRVYLTDVTIANTSASNITVTMRDGDTARWVFPVPANGGVTHRFETPLRGSVDTAWKFDPSAATTTIHCSASGKIR